MNNKTEAEASDKISNLYLTTSMISTTANQASANNEVGYWTGGRQQFGFYIKLRQLLGPMYEKYDKFIISLVKFTAYNESNMVNGIYIEHQIGGLNWVDSAYDQQDRANSYWTHLEINNYSSAQGSYLTASYPNQTKSFVFRRGDNEVLLEFRCINPNSRQPSQPSGNTLPTFTFDFNIQPLIEKKN